MNINYKYLLRFKCLFENMPKYLNKDYKILASEGPCVNVMWAKKPR